MKSVRIDIRILMRIDLWDKFNESIIEHAEDQFGNFNIQEPIVKPIVQHILFGKSYEVS